MLAWIDATCADAVTGPDDRASERTWTTEDITRAWSASAQNVLTMLEDFLNRD